MSTKRFVTIGLLLFVAASLVALAAKGLLKTCKSPIDRRVVLLEATAEGRRMARQCMKTYETWNRSWLATVPKRDLRSALDILQRLAALDPNPSTKDKPCST